MNAFQGIASAIADGKLEGRELLQIALGLVQQLMSLGAGSTNPLGDILSAVFGEAD